MEQRIKEHPILPIPQGEEVVFYWQKSPIKARKGEMIASALMANNIKVFGHHHKDGTAQGIFCANGQCAKCMVIANGMPVKSCMTEVKANMMIESAEGLPELPEVQGSVSLSDIQLVQTDVLIIGGGPAGMAAALQLGHFQIPCILLDDKNVLGGKLVLQTHKFFGSVEDSHAGNRGIEIGSLLAEEVTTLSSVSVWLNSTALYVFSDKKIGVLRDGIYYLIETKMIINAAGAREKFLRFPGNSLAGIYGAGAFQTLVNRDLVRPTDRLFIIGGGNVGLIAGYHALQAGIEVVGLVEAMPQCGGYKVHADKLKRLGVPIYTSHTIVSANGEENVTSVTVAEIDDKFNVIKGTEKTYACDTILIAVGLESLSEFTDEAEKAGIPVYPAGDAYEIAEASSAMFNGKITGLVVAKALGAPAEDIPAAWYDKANMLKSHPGKVGEYILPANEEGVMPIIHCLQAIPCNPCTTVCPTNSIVIPDGTLTSQPIYNGSCIGCGKCLMICPGLAITLVDYRKDKEYPLVTVPYEVYNHVVAKGDELRVVDIDAIELGKFEVVDVISNRTNKVQQVKIRVPKELAKKVASFRIQEEAVSAPIAEVLLPEHIEDSTMVCLCERVTVADIRKWIRKGVTDLNQLKAITRMGMGPCGSKTCDSMVKQIMRQEGIPTDLVIPNTKRPIFIEVPLHKFADGKKE